MGEDVPGVHILSDDDNGCDNTATLPTPEAPNDEEMLDDRVPIDLRFELETLRVNLDLTDQHDSVKVDERYEVLERLGNGAMGTVYKIRDTKLDRMLALKVVGGFKPGRELLQPRLLQEARALARLSHPNVVHVYDVTEANSGEDTIVLELVEGETLRTWQHGRNVDEILDAYIAAANGLAEAHDVGVVHRDFKPDNVMVRGEGEALQVVVIDFGLAGGIIDDTRTSESLLSPIESTGLGTPEYMAPEQHDRPADARCDQYAFCVALWEAVHGQRPFGIARSPADELPPTIARMPGWLQRVLRRGLSFKPRARYRDIHELISRLRRARRVRTAWRWIAVSVGTLGTVIGTALALQPGPCDDVGHSLREIWNEDARERVSTAIEELDASWGADAAIYATEAFDTVVRSWMREATLVCEARTDLGPSPELDRRESCLATWEDRIARSIELLETGDREYGEHIVDVLEPLVAARDVCRLPPPIIDARVRRLLAEADSDERIRRFESALAKAEQACQVADVAPPCVEGSERSFEAAAAHYRLGHVLGKLGRWEHAREELRISADHAFACGDSWTAFDVRVFETFVEAHGEPARPDRATWSLEDARALLVPTTGSSATSLRHAEVLRMAGLLAAARGDVELALDTLDEAAQLLEQIDGPVAQRAKVWHNIGSTAQEAGRQEDAIRAYVNASRLLGESVGPEHSATAAIDINLAIARLEAGELERVEKNMAQLVTYADSEVAAKAYGLQLKAATRRPGANGAITIALAFERWLLDHPQLDPAARREAEALLGKTMTKLGTDQPTKDAGVEHLRAATATVEIEDWPVLHFNLALGLHRAGYPEQAAEVVDTLLQFELEGELADKTKRLKK